MQWIGHPFDDYAAQLAQGVHCPRDVVEHVAAQARSYAALMTIVHEFACCRLMVIVHRDSRAFDVMRDKDKDAIVRLAESLVLRCPDGTELRDEARLNQPMRDSDAHVLCLRTPFSDAAEAALSAVLDRAIAFVAGSDLCAHVQLYDSYYARLDAEFMCQAWARDEAWWSRPPDERGELDPNLVADSYGEALGRPLVRTRQSLITSRLPQ